MKQRSLQKSPTQHTAQLVEHQSDDQEVLGSVPIGDNLLAEFNLLFPVQTFFVLSLSLYGIFMFVIIWKMSRWFKHIFFH